MVIGVCQLELFLHENASLKGKRQVLKSIIQKTRQKFNVSISEVDAQDLWQRAVLGICSVGNDQQVVNSALDKVVQFIEQTQLAEVADSTLEFIHFS